MHSYQLDEDANDGTYLVGLYFMSIAPGQAIAWQPVCKGFADEASAAAYASYLNGGALAPAP